MWCGGGSENGGTYDAQTHTDSPKRALAIEIERAGDGGHAVPDLARRGGGRAHVLDRVLQCKRVTRNFRFDTQAQIRLAFPVEGSTAAALHVRTSLVACCNGRRCCETQGSPERHRPAASSKSRVKIQHAVCSPPPIRSLKCARCILSDVMRMSISSNKSCGTQAHRWKF